MNSSKGISVLPSKHTELIGHSPPRTHQFKERLLSEHDREEENKQPTKKEEKKERPPKKKFFFIKEKPKVPRDIQLNGTVNPPNDEENVIKNQKYNIFTFVPIVLFNQFKFFFNLFFLLNALSQFFPPLQTGYLITYVGPLVLVLALTMAKEAYDDWERYKRDKEANSAKYKRIKLDGTEETVPSSDLLVGDIIEVNANQRIPADLIVLYTPEAGESVFIKTDQLDGETDWKLRKPILYTQKHFEEQRSFKGLEEAVITANRPIENIYQFEGVFQCQNGGGEEYKEPLGLDNTIWGSTVLATGKIYAMVVYTGKEMRVVMNSREPRSKVGRVDLEINRLSKLLFVFLAVLSVALVGMRGFSANWYIHLFRFIILLSYIIPISLRVNLDFAKLFYSYKINHDEDMEGCLARNRDIPEELGRIQFLLTDKTGTLTQNEMIFKKISLENGLVFTPAHKDEIMKYLTKNCEKHNGPLADIEEKTKNLHEEIHTTNRNSLNRGKRRVFRRDKESLLRDLFTALALCHNVTPVMDNNERILQASSPDEIALVQMAEGAEMRLEKRDQNGMTIKNTAGNIEEYEILAMFPFSSQTKRMGIVLKHTESGRIIFYLKGADTVMKDKIPENQRGFLLDECETLAREGLRTLVITQKYLTEDEYSEWRTKYDEACQELEEREEKTQKVVETLEVHMEFLGVTGVEDKLQEDVRSTLENLRNAGIQVWMLTGDKIETATCIAISAGIKAATHNTYLMKDVMDPVEVRNKLEHFSRMSNTVLIIDGATLSVALQTCYKTFFNAATKAPSVICCRCSPTQKATITEGIKKITKAVTCSIGDGGNDVGMIQSADVGIGIEGKEGKQAALAADFSIVKFKHLNKLLLWHGRLSYKRTGSLGNFVIHRGLIIAFIQAIFSAIFYGLSIPIYNGVLALGYSTLFTMFPVFSLIFDEDIDLQRALTYPTLYKTLQKGRELSLKRFLECVWTSVYQGGVIMFLSLAFFDNSYYNIVTITFTALILSEMLNVTTALHKVHIITVISICCSIISYVLVIVLMKSTINASSITLKFLYKVVSLTVISWLPIHMVQILQRKFSPTEEQKLMHGAKLLVGKDSFLDFDHLV